jgi:hypothetical protein
VHSRGGIAHIASDVAWVITAHGVIYSEHMLQKYLEKYELVTRLMCI